jgi:hypothetical protein
MLAPRAAGKIDWEARKAYPETARAIYGPCLPWSDGRFRPFKYYPLWSAKLLAGSTFRKMYYLRNVGLENPAQGGIVTGMLTLVEDGLLGGI